jgi:hypothetical protein
MIAEVLPAALLKRKAVVYVRQSTALQVQTNLESQRRQYDLVEVARRHGFVNVEVIDDDLGRSATGSVARPGFDRLALAFAPEKWGRCYASTLRGWRSRPSRWWKLECGARWSSVRLLAVEGRAVGHRQSVPRAPPYPRSAYSGAAAAIRRSARAAQRRSAG